jgi:hypothetical protein
MNENDKQVQAVAKPVDSASLPSELQAVAIELKAMPSTGAATSQERIPVHDHRSGDDPYQFASHVHSYLRQFIEFSDKKATFVFAIDTAVLVYFFQNKMQLNWLKPPKDWLLADFFVFLTMLTLCLGALFCASVVVPRFTNTHRGLVFFSSIAEHESASDYAVEIFRRTKQELTEAILKHDFDLAKVCKKKFLHLSLGMWCSAIGIFLSIAVLMFNP